MYDEVKRDDSDQSTADITTFRSPHIVAKAVTPDDEPTILIGHSTDLGSPPTLEHGTIPATIAVTVEDAAVAPVPSEPGLGIKPVASRKQQIKWFLQRLGNTSEAIAEALKRRGATGIVLPGRDPVSQQLQARFGIGVLVKLDESGIGVLLDYDAAYPLSPAIEAFLTAFPGNVYPALKTTLPDGDAGLSC